MNSLSHACIARRLWSAVVGAAMLAFVPATQADPVVELQTDHGRIVLRLHPLMAPQTVENFLRYVDDGHYNDTVVHRAVAGFVIQGGGYDISLRYRPTREPIANEAPRCLKNTRGTIAMARSIEPNSTTSQFFVNIDDNNHLNHVKPERGYEGYCAFATVIEGMDVAERISQLPTTSAGPFSEHVPVEPVRILSASRVEASAILAAQEDREPEAKTPAKAPPPSSRTPTKPAKPASSTSKPQRQGQP